MDKYEMERLAGMKEFLLEEKEEVEERRIKEMKKG